MVGGGGGENSYIVISSMGICICRCEGYSFQAV